MQVKYIVYYQENHPLPRVDIWKTNGDLIHSVYAKNHNIVPQNISSQGYLYFNPFLKRWSLEHYQMDDSVPAKTLWEYIKKSRIKKKDRLLVRRKIYQTDFLNDPQLKRQTWEDKKKISALTLRYLFTFQND